MRAFVSGLLALSCALPLWANWGGESGGSLASGTFRPTGTDQVEILKENLVIRLYRDRARVKVDYVLHNTGAAVTVKAGFPCLGLTRAEKTQYEIEDYQLSVDGQKLSHRMEKGDPKPYQSLLDQEFKEMPDVMGNDPFRLGWLTSSVPFAAGQTRKVHVEYEAPYEFSEGGPSGDNYYNDDYFRYLLSTGAAWKGPIREGKVTIVPVTVRPEALAIKPEGRFKNLIWEFKNLEPTLADNLEIRLKNNELHTIMNHDSADRRSWYSLETDRWFFDHKRFTATASASEKGYPVSNLTDFDGSTAWVARPGATVTLTLKTPDAVDALGLIPGYSKSKDLYFANNRVRDLELSVNGGPAVKAHLPDDYTALGPGSPRAYQWVDLPRTSEPVRSLTLKVLSVYPGSRHDDTCISELMLRKRLSQKPEIRGAR